MINKKIFLSNYLDSLQKEGRYTLSKIEALTALQCSEINLSQAINRLLKKKRLFMPRKGFLVIIPLEYQLLGEVPISWYIDSFMFYANAPYYVGLLTAASIYEGSFHNQEFQVLSSTRFRPICTAHSTIHFFRRTHLALTQLENIKTPTGFMKVSSPALTALDLVKYYYACGGLNNVVAILRKLGKKITKKSLKQTLREENNPPISQRFGYLLEFLGYKELSALVQQWLSLKRTKAIPLMTGKSFVHEQLDEKWNLYINEKLEKD